MSVSRNLSTLFVAACAVAGSVVAGTAPAVAQQRDHAAHVQHAGSTAQTMPTMPGQDAFGAIQEIVRILEADPNTNWEKINLSGLREHLVDMNEVTLCAGTRPTSR